MDIKASRLQSSAIPLNAIHKGAAIMRHAINKTDKNTLKEYWEEYYPTHFIYAFFTFNTLYNVDWKKSYEIGKIRDIPRHLDMSEPTKQDKYLDFCFQNGEFVDLYKDLFIKLILRDNTKEELHDVLSSISLNVLPKGNAEEKRKYIEDFRNTMDDLMYKEKFDEDSVSFILGFIYKVRCNVFHGKKTVEEMQKYDQQDRLDVYATIIIALNQMVFSYLDYLCEGKAFVESFDRIYNELSQ